MPDRSNPADADPLETDPRFPSGPWLGFWLQKSCRGRQWMRDLHLRFAQSKIEGYGADCIGAFVIHGHYDLKTGKATLYKAYLGSHTVLYIGQNENDGLWLWGVWEIRGVDRGGFHIWPKGQPDPTQRRLSEEKDIPLIEWVLEHEPASR